MASEKKRQDVYMATRIIVKCFEEQTRSCLIFLTQAASYSLQSFHYKWVNLIQIQREVKWPHFSMGQMSRSHCKKNRWSGRKYCGQLGKIQSTPFCFLIRLEYPSLIFYFRVFLAILTRLRHHATCGILVLDQGSNPGPLQWKCGNHNHWTTREVPKECF